jgi:peptide/nickel transport system substrate-binding protein
MVSTVLERFAVVALLVLGAVVTVVSAQTAPPAGGVLTVATGVEAITLNPAEATDIPSISINRHIYDGLVDYNDKLEIIPALAESWTVSADKQAWTFRLRRNVRFQDGTPLDAAAVKASLDWARDPKSGNRAGAFIGAITAVDVVDGHTVRISTRSPFAPLLRHLASAAGGWIVSPKAIKDAGKNVGRQPVGTGPYKLLEWKVGQEIVLERNPTFWGPRPHFDRVVFKTVREAASRVVMLETGAVDAALNLPPIERRRLESLKDITARTDPTNRLVYIGLSVTKPPLNDVKVRRALNHAIDRQGIIDGILRGQGEAAVSPIGPGNWGHAAVGRYEYDPARAKALLAERGLAGGFPLTIHYAPGRYLMDKEVLEAVQSQLGEIGVKVTLAALEWGSFRALLREGVERDKHPVPSFDAYLFGFSPVTADAHLGLGGQFESAKAAVFNYMRYGNPVVDEAILRGRTTLDAGERREAYLKGQQQIFEDAPGIFLFSERQLNGFKKNLTGVDVFPMHVQFRNARRS